MSGWKYLDFVVRRSQHEAEARKADRAHLDKLADKVEKLYRIAWSHQKLTSGGLAGQGFTSYVCIRCDEIRQHPNTNTPHMCEVCSTEVHRAALAEHEGDPDTEECPPHSWDRSGERCTKCGDKDWM